jgi:hypothetical protein
MGGPNHAWQILGVHSGRSNLGGKQPVIFWGGSPTMKGLKYTMAAMPNCTMK